MSSYCLNKSTLIAVCVSVKNFYIRIIELNSSHIAFWQTATHAFQQIKN